MSPRALQIYSALPGWARSLAATAYGWRVRKWRYGPELERLVRETHQRESWTAEEWEQWSRARLGRLLEHAATEVPWYREQWAERRRRGDTSSWHQIENWPVLEKDALRSNPKVFLTDGADPKSMYAESTSGTTGKPLQLWLSKEAVETWYAMAEARWRRWYGVSNQDRWAILGGQLVAPVSQTKPPFWVWNAALHQLYLSSYHLSAANIPHYVEALHRHRVTYLLGYSSSMAALAEEALRQRLPLPQLKVAISNAEPLLAHQREAIAEAFRCPVRETYGLSENVAAASECDSGRMHIWPESGWLEVLDGSGKISQSGSGELLATGLLNSAMPLIRYRVGDTVTLGSFAACSCGRRLPVLSAVEGRTDDLLYTADGRTIGRLDPVFKREMPLLETQIIQDEIDRLTVRFVRAPGYSPEVNDTIASEIRKRMGPVRIVFEEVERIPRGANGKFRAVISKLPKNAVPARH